MLVALLSAVALATPGPFTDAPLDPAARLIDRYGRAQGADLLYGARGVGALDVAHRMNRVDRHEGLLSTVLAPEQAALKAQGPHWWYRLRMLGSMGVPMLHPALQGGDVEPGLASTRVGADLAARWGSAVAYMRPELGNDFAWETGTREVFRTSPWKGTGPDTVYGVKSCEDCGFGAPNFSLPEAWIGLQTPVWQVGFGKMNRWLGPGRHGGLILTDNAKPAPLGSVAWEDRLGDKWGRLRVEVGAGWLDQPRTDVERPGWLLADFRWAPVPMFEAGATRMGIFGGEGRPSPDIGQLILPTKPHIEGDPEQLLPDQDEIASLDGRLTLPTGAWLDGGPDYLDLYIQYGGEDVIAREILWIPVPSLAGVANLYGLELGHGDWVFDIEHARVLDDRFRWYTGHRIYHQGFTQDGVVMGHPSGGDSHSTHAALRWFPGEWGLEMTYSRSLHVGIAALEGDNLQAFMADMSVDRLGLRGWRLVYGDSRWLQVSAAVARIRNPGFLPGPDDTQWRVAIGM